MFLSVHFVYREWHGWLSDVSLHGGTVGCVQIELQLGHVELIQMRRCYGSRGVMLLIEKYWIIMNYLL